METTPYLTYSCAVVTLSDKGAAGLREDTSGKSLILILEKAGYTLEEYLVIPDDLSAIIQVSLDCIDQKKIDLLVTTGGTGVSPSDVTPEAMDQVIQKEIPGMAEAMRAESLKKTPHAMLSRGRVGIRNQSLIVNLPGSKKASQENIEVILPAIRHALDKIKGSESDCGG